MSRRLHSVSTSISIVKDSKKTVEAPTLSLLPYQLQRMGVSGNSSGPGDGGGGMCEGEKSDR